MDLGGLLVRLYLIESRVEHGRVEIEYAMVW